MNTQSMQNDKLVPAELPEICAPRPELLGLLDQAAAKRCIYISAPAGCGKTVSALLWIQRSGYRPIWLGLDEYDNPPAAFYRFLCAALFSMIPPDESLIRIVKSSAFGVSPVEYTIEVISRLSFDDGRYVLVLDDFHYITSEEITKSLLYIIKRLPLSITVLILSRGEPPRTFSPLKESGKLAFIGAAELAFQSNEIRRHFASFGRFITVKEAEEVFSLTEGWAIAVGALALSGDTAVDGKMKGGLLGQYIETQIWDSFDAELRHFLMQTSVVDEFSPELVGWITGNPNTRKILDMLCGGNLFISRQNGAYRYHHLFLDFLKAQAAKGDKAEQNTLNQRAANYYMEHGDYFNALRYFVKSGDGRRMAAALFGFLKNSGHSHSEISQLHFVSRLPANVLEENPFLYVVCAYGAFLLGDAKGMFFYLDRIYEKLPDILGQHKAFLEGILILVTLDPRYSFSEQAAKFQVGNVPKVENGPPKSLKSLNHNLPFFHRTYRDFSHYALDMEAEFSEFRLIFLELLGGDYELIASGVRSGLLYEKNLLKEAEVLLDQNPETDSAELKFLSKMHWTLYAFAMGREKDAARYRAEIRTLIQRENLLHLRPVISALDARIEMMKGNPKAAAAWLENYFVTEEESPQLNKIFLHFTTARAYILLGEFEKARRLCEKLKKLAEDFCRLLDAAEAAVLLTVLMWLAGEKQEAAALLQRTLYDLEPYRFVRVFADEGRAVLPVLKKLLKRPDRRDDPTMPGCEYLQEVYLAVYEQSKRYKGIACAVELRPIKLSRQQKYVLELLAKGYKNAEIVKLTGLSINTIRVHTRVAYQKLEVNNATDAVLRARELGLIQ
ncbi:MAG: LuxR C-terminal-related transcriptional regulator [Syntrophomonadaceae bacterium]|nr:LuxR C-terminal-related transcriptional regulator [Syntrophomonadaceae bacterium]